ncbi:MAG TPA: phytanoyl-CoA dioxygenase family protein [Thermoanaerobaculia bacterium]
MQVSADALRRDGFGIAERVLSESECGALVETLAASALGRSRAGARHLLSCADVARVAADPRLLRIASLALGGEPVPFRATLFDKSGASNWSVVWHQDTALPLRTRFDAPGWGPWSNKAGRLYAHAPAAALEQVVALRVHLDDSFAANGPLRVLPGTHERGVLSEYKVAEVARAAVSFAECVAGRGGVVAMRPLLIHSSPRGDDPAPRRVLHIEYAETLLVAPGVMLAIA